LVWTLIQVATCDDCSYAMHMQRIFKRLDSFTACGLCYCSRVWELGTVNVTQIIIMQRIMTHCGIMAQSRFLSCFGECVNVEFKLTIVIFSLVIPAKLDLLSGTSFRIISRDCWLCLCHTFLSHSLFLRCKICGCD